MDKPLVSVIMSTYNTNQNYLKEAIDSILKQTYSKFEFIIVCDGQCEDINIIRKYNDTRIKIIEHNENKRLPYSLNEAIQLSKGKYIARMDSDDIAVNTRLEKQVAFLEKNINIDICSMFVRKFGDKNYVETYPFLNDNLIKIHLLFCNIITHPVVMTRKDFLIKNNLLYNEHFINAQDYDLWNRCRKVGQFEIIPIIGLNYRVHKQQISTSKKERQFEFYKEILANNLSEFKEIDLVNTIENIAILFLSENTINIDKLIEISNCVDQLILHNINFKEKDLKKILYLKVFNKSIKSKLILKNFSKIVKNRKLRKQIFRVSNITLNLKKSYYNILCK